MTSRPAAAEALDAAAAKRWAELQKQRKEKDDE